MAAKTMFLTLRNNAYLCLLAQKRHGRSQYFFHEKMRNRYLGNTKMLGPKFCGIKIAEPKNKMLGTMGPFLCSYELK